MPWRGGEEENSERRHDQDAADEVRLCRGIFPSIFRANFPAPGRLRTKSLGSEESGGFQLFTETS